MEVNSESIDWDNLLNFVIPEDLNFDFDFKAPELYDKAAVGGGDGVESWMNELEDLLMKDDHLGGNGDGVVVDEVGKRSSNDLDLQVSDFQVSDLFIDFPDGGESGREGDVKSGEAEVEDKNWNANSAVSSPSVGNEGKEGQDHGGSPNFESNGEEENGNYKSDGGVVEVNDDDDDDNENGDPLSKKRKRQLRNRDAAMRSRERKKMYVKDLESKSRFLEAECRRLGRLLQICYAENLSLRAYVVPMTKPESAVLLLESLLLGSLVWFLVNICLLPQPRLPLHNQDSAIRVSLDRKDRGSAAPERKETKTIELWSALSFMRSKRCRASKTKMKSHFEHHISCN